MNKERKIEMLKIVLDDLYYELACLETEKDKQTHFQKHNNLTGAILSIETLIRVIQDDE
jgi:hypothetical protein